MAVCLQRCVTPGTVEAETSCFHAAIIEVLTMPTFEMQREIVVSFICTVWKIANL